jgi:hypothetical protein
VQLIIENIKDVIGVPFPDIMYDGSKNPENQNEDGSTPNSLKICIMNNHSDTFVNLDLNNDMEHLSFEKSDHLCELNRLEPVKISL